MKVPEKVLEALQGAQKIAVLTGAGMSAESGVPTFRDVQTGLWARYDPMTLATAEAFEEEPDLVWAWYLKRAQLIRAVAPNAGHRALSELAASREVRIVTQNVDDLHERAGSTRVKHLHGSLFDFRCFACAAPYAEEVVIPEQIEERIAPPRCPSCDDRVRPGIVWFGEYLPPEPLQEAMEDATECDAMVVIGTSGVVQPAASLPAMARGAGVPCVEINPEETRISDYMDACWRSSAAEALPQLVAALA